MKISELMGTFSVDPSYEGPLNADTNVFAIDISNTKDAEVADYVVARESITSLGGALNPTVESKSYFSGSKDVRTGTKRTFTIPGDVYVGDAFLDYVLSYEVKFGTGSNVDVPYVYFNHITGKGEKGICTLSVTEDVGGEAAAVQTFSVTASAIGIPAEWNYTTTPA